MKSVVLLLFISLGFYSNAQIFSIFDADLDQGNPMDCGAIAAGGTNFIDMGGNYQANLDETIVFCPDLTQGTKVTATFATNIGYEFNIHQSDTLFIYDGPSTASPLLAAINSSTDINGGTWQASWLNTSGCLTFRFKSDGANEGTGWVAKVSCGNIPQPFVPHLEAFVNGSAINNLNPIDTGYVNLCLGDSVLLVAKPVFPYAQEVTGFGYSQNTANCSYNWTISGVGPLNINNDSVWFVPTARQGYFIDLKITDPFPQITRVTAKSRVSQLPIFAGTGPKEDTVCLGLNTQLIGGVTASDTVGVEIPGGEFSVGGTFAGLTFLPDGTGQLYETDVNMTGLGAGTVTSASDIASICLDIEHSFIGDIEIALTCPNGTIVSLMNTYNGFNELVPAGCGGGGICLGSDTDQDGGAPGSPVLTYCFSTVAPQFGTVCNNLTNTFINSDGNVSMIPGTYTPDGNFADFIGCPLEGDWTISVQDNQGIDDGYIFQWGITFDASLYPESETYQNVITSDFWSANPTIVSGQTDTAIVVVPTASGPINYQYNVVDDFGCEYDTTVVLYVLPQPTIFNDTVACDFQFNVTGTTAYNGGVWTANDTCVHFLPNANVNNPVITSSKPGTYTVTFTDNACSTVISSDIFFQQWAWTSVIDSVVCEGTLIQGYAGVYSQNESYIWNTGAVGPELGEVGVGEYIVTVQNFCNTHTDTLSITSKICDIAVPNILLLNSSDGNNTFFIDYSGVKEIEVSILNRWGNVIQEFNKPDFVWNGKNKSGEEVEDGVYFYMIRAILDNDEELNKQGFVQVFH